MSTEDNFCQTGTEVARHSGLTAQTIRAYTRAGLLECQQLSNGTRVYSYSAIAKAKKLREQNRVRRLAALRQGGNQPAARRRPLAAATA
jgi:DNA-binding transcriptional MerR regulator